MDNQNIFVATEVFADVLAEARVIKVDPSACIPFINVRSLVLSGVERIKHSLASSDREDQSIATGAMCGGSLPTVVVLSGPFRHYVISYFVEQEKLSKKDAETKASTREVWYGIVDGNHRLVALMKLREEMPQRWAGFQWSVLLLRGTQSVKVLRAFARAQNMRQTNEQFIETTIYDLLSGLQEEANRLTMEAAGRRPSAKEVADRYSASSERTSHAMRTLAGIALKLSRKVVDQIGDVMNFECPVLACTYYSVKGRQTYTEADVQKQADCRVYRNFLTMTSLRQATAFLNAHGDDAEELQINALLRLRDCCRNSGFKPVMSGMVLEQYSRASAAYHEAKKFETLLCNDVWPRGMEKLRDNLLRTTILDDDVKENDGNGKDILPAILQEFRRCMPHKAPLLEARYFSSIETPEVDLPRSLDGECRVPEDGQVLENEETEVASERPALTQPPQPGDVTDGHELLLRHGITCFEMDWQQYNRSLHSSTDDLYDLILTEPPRGVTMNKPKLRKGVDETMDEREMKELAQFAQRVLVPGGYILIFTTAKYFKDWVMVLRACDFKCMDYPFVIATECKGLQRQNRHLFPQNVCDLVVMACSPGRNAKGFEADFTEAYRLVRCPYKRKFAAIVGVPVVSKKLRYEDCRSIVCTSEKNPDLLAELMVTFSPPGGVILDPYAGTMSTGAACLNIARRCTLIEKDSECFKLAFNRLVGLAKAQDLSHKAHFVPETPPSSEDFRVRSCEDYLISSSQESKEHGANSAAQSTVDSGAAQPGIDVADGDDYLGTDSVTGRPLSFPSTPSSPAERPTQLSQKEDVKVDLLKDGVVVARAEISTNAGDASSFRTELHGSDLSRFEKEQERLVVVWKVNVLEAFKNETYPYRYGGPDGPVERLSEMESGFHAWDLGAMHF